MYRKPSLLVLCLLLLLLSSCVSKSKYVQLEAENAEAKHKLRQTETRLCLLYTSDAADDWLVV